MIMYIKLDEIYTSHINLQRLLLNLYMRVLNIALRVKNLYALGNTKRNNNIIIIV